MLTTEESEAHVAIDLSQRHSMSAWNGMALDWAHAFRHCVQLLWHDNAKLPAAPSTFAGPGRPWPDFSCTWRTGRPYSDRLLKAEGLPDAYKSPALPTKEACSLPV